RLPGRPARGRADVRHAPRRLARGPRLREGMAPGVRRRDMTAAGTALVIGGGIAGPVTAMALRRAGIEATVYEAYATTADGVGGGLSIAPNGLAALGVLGADDLVRQIGIPMTSMVMESWTGKRLAEFGGPASESSMQFVWRTDLYR